MHPLHLTRGERLTCNPGLIRFEACRYRFPFSSRASYSGAIRCQQHCQELIVHDARLERLIAIDAQPHCSVRHQPTWAVDRKTRPRRTKPPHLRQSARKWAAIPIEQIQRDRQGVPIDRSHASRSKLFAEQSGSLPRCPSAQLCRCGSEL